MTTLRIGIASYEAMKARTVAMARGEYTLHGQRLSFFKGLKVECQQ